MVRTIVAGRAGVSALAREHGVVVSVYDVAVDADLSDLPAEVTARKVRRGSGAIHLEDALTRDEAERSLALGAAVAGELVDDGAQLLMTGDLGIGNTTPAAALVAALARAARRRGHRSRHRHRRRRLDPQARRDRCCTRPRVRADRRPGGPPRGARQRRPRRGRRLPRRGLPPWRAGRPRRPHVRRLRRRRARRRARRLRLVGRRAPLDRARPGPRAQVPRPRAAARRRHAARRGLRRGRRAPVPRRGSPCCATWRCCPRSCPGDAVSPATPGSSPPAC